MAIPTVRDLQQHALPAGARLVAGAAGLSRPVSWPATLRTRAPGFPPLKGGELLLISTESLHVLDASLGLSRLLQRVERIGIAGAAILGCVDDRCVAYADERELPLFVLPAGTHLAELEATLARILAEARSELHRRAHDVYRQLTQLAIEGRGLAAIAEELDRVTGKPAAVLDPGLAPLAWSRTCPDDVPPIEAAGVALAVRGWADRVPIAAARAPVEFFRVGDGRGLLIAPVMARAAVAAFVAVSARADQLDELDRSALAGAAAAAAIELARRDAVLSAEERIQADTVEELLAGSSPVSDALRRRAARLPLDVDRAHLVVASTTLAPAAPSTAIDAWQRQVRSALPDAQVGRVDGRVVLLSPVADPRLATIVEHVRQDLSQRLSVADVSCGVGSYLPGVEGLRQSYREAVAAAELGAQLFGPGRTVAFRDIGLYRLLLNVRDHPEVGRFYDETLGKLLARDTRAGGELLRTLDVYFSCHGRPTDAAARLNVHRNTLLYRLQRIRAVTGVDLDDPEVRLALQVALRIHRLRRALG